MRNGLESMLLSEPGFEIAGIAADGMSAVRAAAELQPDIVLMDLTLPLTSGIDAMAQIKQKSPNIKVVALTYHKEEQYIHAALQAGADAYVLKDDSRVELFTALSNVIAGKSYLSPSVAGTVVAGYVSGTSGPRERSSWEVLTRREREVIKLIAEGLRTKDIASLLSLSPKTVEKHRTNMMRKLDLHSVSEVTVYALQNGFIPE
jgi:DNA-binding NarL/FixJ family response regulator